MEFLGDAYLRDMKSVKVLFFFIITVILFSSCQGEITPEDLGRNVLEAFQKNDVDMALEYILYEDDYEDFYGNSELGQEDKERLITKYCGPGYVDERVERFKKRFPEIIEQGKAEGIFWANTQFEYVEGPNNPSIYGMQADEIYVIFSHESKLYKLRLDDCLKTSRGWLMSDEPSFKGEIES